MNENINYFIDLLRNDGSIIINKNLARNIGIHEAILYSELLSKHTYFKNRNELDKGYFFNTVENMLIDTNLSEFQQRKTIKSLISYDLIDYKVKGIPAKRYFKINMSEKIIKKYLRTSSLETKELEPEKLKGNNTKYNNTNISFNKLNDSEVPNRTSRMKKDSKELDYEDALKATRYCLDTFYKKYKILHPKINKDTFYKKSNIYKSNELVKKWINGFKENEKNDLRLFIKSENLKFYFNEGFYDEDEFIDFFKKAINIYNLDFNPVKKDNLPKHLIDFLYNPFANFKSYFLYFAFNEPTKIELKKSRKDKHPKITKKYKQLIYKDNELDVDDVNKLISNVNNIVNELDSIVNKSIEFEDKKYKRSEFESDNFDLYLSNITRFTNLHIDYLKTIQEYKKLNINYVYVGGEYWRQFSDYVKKTHNINLYLNKNQLVRKCKLFTKFKT